jgi:hypothetical protein
MSESRLAYQTAAPPPMPTDAGPSGLPVAPIAERILDKLRPRLAALVGSGEAFTIEIHAGAGGKQAKIKATEITTV